MTGAAPGIGLGAGGSSLLGGTIGAGPLGAAPGLGFGAGGSSLAGLSSGLSLQQPIQNIALANKIGQLGGGAVGGVVGSNLASLIPGGPGEQSGPQLGPSPLPPPGPLPPPPGPPQGGLVSSSPAAIGGQPRRQLSQIDILRRLLGRA